MDGFAPYCRHYRYENECPPGRDYETFDQWWYLERSYLLAYDKIHTYWENEGIEEYFNNGILNTILDYIKKFPKPIMGFLAYCAVTVYNYDPASGVSFIYNYDKEIDFPI